MEMTISKILNKTDLAKSGSHGGLTVTKDVRNTLVDFFGGVEQEHNFQDKDDEEVFSIRYAAYTSNETTPSDRVTPIGKYASKHELRPGDNLIFSKSGNVGAEKYFINYVRKENSVYFIGKSNDKVEALDCEQFISVIDRNVEESKITRSFLNKWKVQVRYQGISGILTIAKKADKFELHFNKEHIEEKNKYFELDTSTHPFILKKTETWKIEMNVDAEEAEINDDEDRDLVKDMVDLEWISNADTYIAEPEDKKPGRNIGNRVVPNRDRDKANKALARAAHLCEYDTSHTVFVRKKQPINYTEPHHLIPLKCDNLFGKSLDVQANIVSLCSHCHNLIHYGADAEVIVRKLWEDRVDQLRDAGICVTESGMELTTETILGFYGIK